MRDSVWLVMEYMAGGDLRSFLAKQVNWAWGHRYAFLTAIWSHIAHRSVQAVSVFSELSLRNEAVLERSSKGMVEFVLDYADDDRRLRSVFTVIFSGAKQKSNVF